MGKYFSIDMVYDKKKVKEALRVIQNGHHNKWKYVEAKDLICRVSEIYLSGGLVKVSTLEPPKEPTDER